MSAVILSEAKDLEMRGPRIWKSFAVFASQDDGGLTPLFHPLDAVFELAVHLIGR